LNVTNLLTDGVLKYLAELVPNSIWCTF